MLQVGDKFGSYKVVKLLGQGGMGSVFLLENADGTKVAAKILDPESSGDHESRVRFLHEAEIALNFKNPGIINTYDIGEDPDTHLCYILMEYVPGGTLANLLRATGKIGAQDAIMITREVAKVLEQVREHGIVHRDIKPENIMFGSDGRVKVADLGIARSSSMGEGTTVTKSGVIVGTPAYMAPEQMMDSHAADTRSDIYSLGIMLHEMLVGVRPNHDATLLELMAKAVQGSKIPDIRTIDQTISAPLAYVVAKMCEVDPKKRYQTPGEVAADLKKVLNGDSPIIAPTPTSVKRPSTSVKKRSTSIKKKFPVKLIAAIASVIVTITVFAILGASGSSSSAPKNNQIGAEPTAKTAMNSLSAIAPERPKFVSKPLDPSIAPNQRLKEENGNLILKYTKRSERKVAQIQKVAHDAYDTLSLIMGPSFDANRKGEIHFKDRDETFEADFAPCSFKYGFWSSSAPRIGISSSVLDSDELEAGIALLIGNGFSGLYYSTDKAESRTIQFALAKVLGVQVARQLGHVGFANKIMNHLEARMKNVLKEAQISEKDVMLSARPREGAKPKPVTWGNLDWVIEYRVAKIIDELCRKDPYVLSRYFSLRAEYRRTSSVISDGAFVELLSKAANTDLFPAFNELGSNVHKEPQWDYITAKGEKVFRAEFDGYDLYYTIKDGNAVISKPKADGSGTECAAVVKTNPKIVVPGEIEGMPVIVGSIAFAGGMDIVEIIMREGVMRVGFEAFVNCPKLERIVFPRSVKKLDNGASLTWGSWNVKEIDFSMVENFSGECYWGIGSLERILIEKDNPAFVNRNGLIIQRADKGLVFYPRDRKGEINIPEGVALIGGGALWGYGKVKELKLPSSLKAINFHFNVEIESGELALPEGFKRLNWMALKGLKVKRLILPKSLSTIGPAVFEGSSISEITFLGNVPEELYDSWAKGLDPAKTTIYFDKNTRGWDKLQCPVPLKPIEEKKYLALRVFDNLHASSGWVLNRGEIKGEKWPLKNSENDRYLEFESENLPPNRVRALCDYPLATWYDLGMISERKAREISKGNMKGAKEMGSRPVFVPDHIYRLVNTVNHSVDVLIHMGSYK